MEKELEKQSYSPEVESLLLDIFSHAITGEVVGMQHYAAMVPLFVSWKDKVEALEHAESEKEHALAFAQAAAELGMQVVVNPQGAYWSRMSERFSQYVLEKDLTCCILAQEIVFESMAIALYLETGKSLDGHLKDLFLGIGEAERSHRSHSIGELAALYRDDREVFAGKAYRVHQEIMGAVAEMLAAEDTHGHCGVCNGNCVKGNLHHLKLSIQELKGNTLALYLDALDSIGLPGELTLRWAAELI